MDSLVSIGAMEWTGAVLGLLGALLLSLNHRVSRYGWPLFLLSNFMWIGFGIATDAWGLVFMQIVFTLTSVNGLVQWFVRNKK